MEQNQVRIPSGPGSAADIETDRSYTVLHVSLNPFTFTTTEKMYSVLISLALKLNQSLRF